MGHPSEFSIEKLRAESVIRQLNQLVGNELPKVKEVIPNYQIPDSDWPTLIVSDFENNNTESLDWGRAIGQILRWNLQYSYFPAPIMSNSYGYLFRCEDFGTSGKENWSISNSC